MPKVYDSLRGAEWPADCAGMAGRGFADFAGAFSFAVAASFLRDSGFAQRRGRERWVLSAAKPNASVALPSCRRFSDRAFPAAATALLARSTPPACLKDRTSAHAPNLARPARSGFRTST